MFQGLAESGVWLDVDPARVLLIVERLRFFSEVLNWHVDDEDELVFPAMDKVDPLVAQAPPQAEPSAASPTPAAAQPPPAPVGAPPAATYTGRIYLMFPSSLSQGRLESVWEVLDQVAGTGNITETG